MSQVNAKLVISWPQNAIFLQFGQSEPDFAQNGHLSPNVKERALLTVFYDKNGAHFQFDFQLYVIAR